MNGRAVLHFARWFAPPFAVVGLWCALAEAAVFIQWQDTALRGGAAASEANDRAATRARRGAAAASRPTNRSTAGPTRDSRGAARARMHGESRFAPELGMRRRSSLASQMGLAAFDRPSSRESFGGSAGEGEAFRRLGAGWDGPPPAGAEGMSDLDAALGKPTLVLSLLDRLEGITQGTANGAAPRWSELLTSEVRSVGGPLGSAPLFGPVTGQRAGGAASTGLLSLAQGPRLEPFDGWSTRPVADSDLEPGQAKRRDAEPVAFAIWCAIGAVGAGAYYRLR
jgi:hypothetical protein